QEFSQVIDNDVRTLRRQLLRIAFLIHTDYKPKGALRARADAGDGVLDDHSALRTDAEHLRSLQKGIRRGRSGKPLLGDDVVIDTRIKKVSGFRRLKDFSAILAGRHNCSLNPQPTHIHEEGDAAWISYGADRCKALVDQFVFSIAETANTFSGGRIL